jgi:hypothetical protein
MLDKLSYMAALPSGEQSDPLLCPHCGGGYLHHELITVFDRREDADFVTRTRVSKNRVTREAVKSEVARNPSCRRDGLAVSFSCETCAARPELTIKQEKGQTFFTWRDTEWD